MVEEDFSVSISSVSIDNIGKSDNPSCPIEVLRWFLISFSLEKLLSAVALVTGRVKNSRYAVIISGKLEARLLKSINVDSASSLIEWLF
ncbi:hypothetical protein TNCV_3160781 [Trichonephila clavipes]|nr:hypothetical protein TNCV_3160781 [Trichonephila clavipes]